MVGHLDIPKAVRNRQLLVENRLPMHASIVQFEVS